LTARVQRGPSEAARCASTEDHQAPSPLLLREQGIGTGVIPLLSSCAFCEQEGHLAAPHSSFGGRALREHRRSSGSIPSSAPGARDRHGCHSTSFIVRVLRARRAPGRSPFILRRPRVARAQKIIRLHPLFCSGSKGSARVSFHFFHRARSASKKGTWPLPIHPSEAARCASTGDSPGHPSPALADFFSIMLMSCLRQRVTTSLPEPREACSVPPCRD
jgi:hypothetical protein